MDILCLEAELHSVGAWESTKFYSVCVRMSKSLIGYRELTKFYFQSRQEPELHSVAVP